MAHSSAPERLNLARGEMSFAWLAEQLGVSRGYVNNLVRGHRTPSLAVANRIHERFGIRPEEWATAPEEVPQ